MKRRLIICRHTQTDYNLKHRYTGHKDVSVNPTGKAQAAALAKRISGLSGICGIISSDLTRTLYLAEAIARRTGHRVYPFTELREVALGRLEGLEKMVVIKRYPGHSFRTTNPQFDFRSVGGECAQSVIDRQIAALKIAESLFARQATAPVARLVVVGHGTALRPLFQDHLGVIDKLHEQGEYQEVDWPF